MKPHDLWDLLRGRYTPIERKVIEETGEMPNVVEAHDRLVASQHKFYSAVVGVVEENQELRRRLNARKTS